MATLFRVDLVCAGRVEKEPTGPRHPEVRTMKLVHRSILPLALVLAIALPSSLWAQGRGNARGHDKNKDKHEQVLVIDRDRDDRDDRNPNVRNRDDRDDRIVRDWFHRNRNDRDVRNRNDRDDRVRDWFRRDRDDRGRNDRERFFLRDRGRTIILYDDDLFWYPIRNGSGPSFCRSGAGHPVWGLEWCLDKGYGIGRPGMWFLRGDDLFLRDGNRVLVLRNRADDADRAFWGAVVNQLLALVN